jgi:hypothetical protein
MGLFGKIVKTAINVATLPVAVTKDIFTLGGSSGGTGSYTVKKLEQIKEEADD